MLPVEAPAESRLDQSTLETFRRLDAQEARQDATAGRMRTLAAVLFVGFLVTLLIETLAVRQAVDQALRAAAQSAARASAARRRSVAKADVHTMLPAAITGYVTKSRQMVPGSSDTAEGIYEPEDMNLQLARPTTVYCQVTRFPSPAEAEAYVQERFADFPMDRATISVSDVVAISGLSTDRNQYAILFADGNVAAIVKAMFTQSDPVDKGTTLQTHGKAVAERVAERIREVKAGVYEDSGEETE